MSALDWLRAALATGDGKPQAGLPEDGAVLAPGATAPIGPVPTGPATPTFYPKGPLNGLRMSDLLRSAFDGAVDAGKLPKDVYEGKVDPLSDEGIRRAFNMAGTLAGQAPLTGQAGAAGVFGGRLAAERLGKLDPMIEAQMRNAMGEGRDDVLSKTGFFQGADGKWRFEIPDVDAKLTKPAGVPEWNYEDISKFGKKEIRAYAKGLQTGNWDDLEKLVPAAEFHPSASQGTLAERIRHPDLFTAYPDMAQLPLEHKRALGAGAYYMPPGGPKPEHIALNFKTADTSKVPLSWTVAPTKDWTQDDMRDVLLHEIQHAIQQREKFAGGTNTTAKDVIQAPSIKRMRDMLTEYIDNPGSDAAVASQANYLYEKAKHEIYSRAMGEVEARNVQARKDLPLQWLHEPWNAPYRTEDRPWYLQWAPGK